MSHTLTRNQSTIIPVTITIPAYVSGGESFTAADAALLGISGAPSGVHFATVPADQNSLAVPLFPIWDGNILRLFQFTGGNPAQIATNANLDAVISALVLP